MTNFGKLIFSLAFLVILVIVIFFLQRKTVVPVVEIPKENQVIDLSVPPLGNKIELQDSKDDKSVLIPVVIE